MLKREPFKYYSFKYYSIHRAYLIMGFSSWISSCVLFFIQFFKYMYKTITIIAIITRSTQNIPIIITSFTILFINEY